MVLPFDNGDKGLRPIF